MISYGSIFIILLSRRSTQNIIIFPIIQQIRHTKHPTEKASSITLSFINIDY